MSGHEHASDPGTAGAAERPDGEDAVAELEAATEAYHAARDAIEAVGREQLESLEEAHRRARNLLLEYRDKATDTGAQEFLNFAQFEHQFTEHVEGLDDDLPRREAFEEALEAVDKTRLDEGDFERALDALEPASELLERFDEEEAARDRLVDAIADARRARQRHENAVERCERLLELGEADLEAPTEELREPVETWNEAVRGAVSELRTDAPARDLFAVLDRADRYPLVDLDAPPEPLREYVETAPAGEEPVVRLLEYADYSRSKLAHYVDDPDAFRSAIATERSYLEGLDASGLTIDWPPPPAAEIPWLARELRGVAGGLVDGEATAALRELAELAREADRYGRLRDAAVARAQLDADDRERLASGAVEAELSEHREATERIDAALEAAPDP